MQNIILALAIILLTSITSMAQCDKKVKWQASRAEMLDESGNVMDKKEGTIQVTTDSKNIVLEIAENPNDKLEGTVSESSCDWTEAFKTGKSSFKATMIRVDGKSSGGTFSVEGKDGKLVIHVQLDVMQGKKVLIYVDKYEII